MRIFHKLVAILPSEVHEMGQRDLVNAKDWTQTCHNEKNWCNKVRLLPHPQLHTNCSLTDTVLNEACGKLRFTQFINPTAISESSPDVISKVNLNIQNSQIKVCAAGSPDEKFARHQWTSEQKFFLLSPTGSEKAHCLSGTCYGNKYFTCSCLNWESSL